jgi:hypothetical protein
MSCSRRSFSKKSGEDRLGDSDDPAQTSKEALAEIAENAPPIPPGPPSSNPQSGKSPSMAPIADEKDGTEETKLPKRGGRPPEYDPPAA